MRRGRRAAHKRPPWPERVFHEEIEPLIHDPAPMRRVGTTTLLGIVVALSLAAVVLGVLRAAGIRGHDTGTTSPRRDTSSTPPSTPARSPTVADGTALNACQQLWSLEQEVLTVARPAMNQWDTHIVAMNQLVAGRITLDQAVAFWNKTRLGATRHVHAFDAADRRLRSTSGLPCAAASTPGDTSPALAACLAAVDAAHTTLGSARTTIATWSHHVRDMERLRRGKLSPAMARQMWLQTWKQGVRELRTYRRDEVRSESLTCPS